MDNSWYHHGQDYAQHIRQMERQLRFDNELIINDRALDKYSGKNLGFRTAQYKENHSDETIEVFVTKNISLDYYNIGKILSHQNILRLENYTPKSLVITEVVSCKLTNYIKHHKDNLFVNKGDNIYSISRRYEELILRGIFERLQYAHSMNTYHPDFSLDNIYVREDESGHYVKISSFKETIPLDHSRPLRAYNSKRLADFKNMGSIIRESFDTVSYGLCATVEDYIDFLANRITKSNDVFKHPIFWDDERKRSYIFWLTSGDKWTLYRSSINNEFYWPSSSWIDQIINYNPIKDVTYDQTKPYDFVRLLDNKLKHYDNLPANFKARFGMGQDEFAMLRFIENIQPTFWIDLFNVVGPIGLRE